MFKKMSRVEGENEILKIHGHVYKEVSSIYKFITDNKGNHDIKLMYKILKVSRSSYYKFLNKK